ncbi:MAG: sulfotransferase domain-containing protein [Deltaproteobacteria bacterium]|nr:sulfotransferase domain-containing protein [Deltaproteobacteria bacterium]
MLIWLASYPRSGNTLLRMIMKSVFGLETYSKYDDRKGVGKDKETSELVGHRMLGGEWKDVYLAMRDAKDTFFVKTHDLPEDGAKAIYVVRDGRCAVVSYRHYLKDFNETGYPLAEVIAGFVPFGSWGCHLDAWSPTTRPDTLFIRYEDLVASAAVEVKKIADFLGVKPVGEWKNDFELLHRTNPRFFRQGDSSKSAKAVQGDDLELFWLLHGDWMRALGYVDGDGAKRQTLPFLRNMMGKRSQDETRRRLDKARSDNASLAAACEVYRKERDAAASEVLRLREEMARLRAESEGPGRGRDETW